MTGDKTLKGKLKVDQHIPLLQPEMNSCATEGYTFPAPLGSPVMLCVIHHVKIPVINRVIGLRPIRGNDAT